MNSETKPKTFVWAAVVVLVSIVVVVNLFRGLTVQKIGIPGIFEVEFGNAGSQPQTAEILTFQADSHEIREGESATLRWKTSEATEILLNGEPVAPEGNRVVRPASTTTYQLAVRGASNSRLEKLIVVNVMPATGEQEEPDGDETGPEPTLANEDCLPYNPQNLRIEDEGARGWLLTDGDSRMLMLASEQDARKALAMTRQHTSHCFIGRDNQRTNRRDYIMQYWKGDSGLSATIPNEDCLPYNRGNLRIEDEGNRGWLLTDGSSRMVMLANEQDARNALAVARQHNMHCFIGRDNQRSDRQRYIVEYWK
ncbi:MAG: hypothetical protein R3281_18220 [Balneolaceae bacterium]|nr:hypothetical protein [Balneolaceae bacterium]